MQPPVVGKPACSNRLERHSLVQREASAEEVPLKTFPEGREGTACAESKSTFCLIVTPPPNYNIPFGNLKGSTVVPVADTFNFLTTLLANHSIYPLHFLFTNLRFLPKFYSAALYASNTLILSPNNFPFNFPSIDFLPHSSFQKSILPKLSSLFIMCKSVLIFAPPIHFKIHFPSSHLEGTGHAWLLFIKKYQWIGYQITGKKWL